MSVVGFVSTMFTVLGVSLEDLNANLWLRIGVIILSAVVLAMGYYVVIGNVYKDAVALKKLGPSFNCRFSATAVDSPCKRIPISEELLEEIVRNALTAQIKQAEYVLEILHERERKALICFSALERQEEKLSAKKTEIVKQRVALYEQYADGNMIKEEFIRQRDAYRAQEDEKMEQIQRLRTEKNQVFQPVKKDTDNLQGIMDTVGEAGDVMHLSQNVVETFIDRIEVFNDERVKIRFTFEDVLKSYEAE